MVFTLSIHVELNRNKEDKDPYSNNVISADADAVYEDVGKEKSLPGYAELDQAKRGKDADTLYQNLHPFTRHRIRVVTTSSWVSLRSYLLSPFFLWLVAIESISIWYRDLADPVPCKRGLGEEVTCLWIEASLGLISITDLNYWIKHPFEFSDPILKPEYL